MKIAHRAIVLALTAILLSAMSACSQSEDGSRSTRRAITQSQAIATDFLRTELALSPETSSRLDLERFLGPTASYMLDNHSQAGFERRRLVHIELLQRLQRRPPLSVDHPLTRDLAIAELALVDLIALEQLGYGRYDYNDYRPYAVDPFSGVWIEGVTLLAYRQSINTASQARAFVTRLQSLSPAIQDTKRRLIADNAAGIVLPRSLATETRRRLTLLGATDITALDYLTETFAALTLDLDDLEPEEREQLIGMVRREISNRLRPAMAELAETLSQIAEEASDQAGIWAQPKGQELFLGILRASTGDQISTATLHQRHIDETDARVQTLRSVLVIPEELTSADLERPDRLSALLPWYEELTRAPATRTAPDASVEPTPRDTLQDFAPSHVWNAVSEGAVFEAQSEALRQFRELWMTQPYLTWQMDSDADLMPYRELIEFSAIEDARRLYVWEHQIDEGFSVDNPILRAGHQSIGLMQTVLAAADTGIHLNRWPLDDATDYIAVNTGLNEPLSRELAMRIMARPGYYSAVMVAFHRMETLSERAQAVLGERYSETDFQRTLIQLGPRPLSLIETDIEAWYGARLSN